MPMKRIQKRWALLWAGLSLGLLVSCGSEEGLVGTWAADVDMSVLGVSEQTDSSITITTVYVFGEDGGCYVFTNGKMITCTWNRKDEFSPNVLLDADGNEVILNQGKTWICNIWSDYQNYIELY